MVCFLALRVNGPPWMIVTVATAGQGAVLATTWKYLESLTAPITLLPAFGFINASPGGFYICICGLLCDISVFFEANERCD